MLSANKGREKKILLFGHFYLPIKKIERGIIWVAWVASIIYSIDRSI